MKRLMLVVVCCLFVVSCRQLIENDQPVVIQQGQGPAPSPTPPPLPTRTLATATPDIPTATVTLTLTPTNTFIPSLTPSATATRPPTNTPRPSSTPTRRPPDATNTPRVTSTDAASATPGPTNTPGPTATNTPPPTATDVNVSAGSIAFENSNFAGGWRFAEDPTLPGNPGPIPELGVANEWFPYWDASFKRPEYKILEDETAVGFNQPFDFGGLGDRTAQKWFCQFDRCDAGIYQEVAIPTDYECRVRARVSAVSSQNDYRRSDIFDNRQQGTQDFQDALNGARWYISINGTRDFTSENPFFGNNKGLIEITWLDTTFTSPGGEVRIEIGNVRRYGEQYQDSFVYDTELSCTE